MIGIALRSRAWGATFLAGAIAMACDSTGAPDDPSRAGDDGTTSSDDDGRPVGGRLDDASAGPSSPDGDAAPASSSDNPVAASVAVILEVDADTAPSDALGLRHAFDAFGIPYVRTGNVTAALRAPELVVVAGRWTMDDASSRSARHALADWARTRGHTLVLSGSSDAVLLGALGVAARPVDGAGETFSLVSDHALTGFADTPEERVVRSTAAGSGNRRRMSYRLSDDASGDGPSTFSPFAHWDDGTVGDAVLEDRRGGGRVVLFGGTATARLTRYEVGLGPSSGSCSNAFVPSLDVARLLLRRVYSSYTRHPVERPLAPEGRKAAVILTHDMDATTAFGAFRDAFSPVERARGVRSTLFTTTSWRSTHWIAGFYSLSETQAVLAEAHAAGFDLQSHSVSHAPDFASFPDGAQSDDAGAYLPTYDSATHTTNGGAVLPELLVSRGLLERDFGVSVRGFRAGYLARPRRLAELEERSGYTYDATFCHGTVAGSFPYFGVADLATTASETNVLELPLSIGDDAIETRTADETQRRWLDVTTKNAANGAPTVILVHPTDPERKIGPYVAWLDAVLARGDLWVGSMDAYYRWYVHRGARSELTVYPF